MDWTAVGLSLRLATFTSAILLVLGLPLAYWLTFSRSRARFLVEALTALPLVLPPTVLGFYLLLAMGPRGPLGRAWGALTDEGLPFSFTGLLIASVLYSLPFAVQPFAGAFAGVDRRYIEAAWCLGRSKAETFVRVVLPMASRGVLAGVVLCFAHTLGEFGVVLMVGGNLPGQTRTISIAIYDAVQAMDYASAGTTSAFLLAVSFLTLAFVYGVQRNAILTWPTRS